MFHHSKKTMETRIIKNIFNKNGRCRNVKTQKYANKVGRLTQDPKLNQPLPYNSTYEQLFVFAL